MNIITVVAAALMVFFLGDGSAAQDKPEKEARIYVTTSAAKSGWLGVRIEDMTPRLARRMNVATETGALVNEVIAESPAERAGIKEDDIIVGFHGRTIDDADELRTTVAKADPGQSVQVTVMRRNEKKALTAEVGKAPHSSASWHTIVPGAGRHVRLFANRLFTGQKLHGMTMMNLGKQLAAYFEVPGKGGVLIEEVEQKSAAEKSGLRAGDVVLKIGKEPVSDMEDVRDELEDAKKGDRIEVTVLRRGKQSTVNLEIEETLGDVYEGFGPFDIEAPLPPEDIELDLEVPDVIRGEPGHMEELRHHLEEVRSEMELVRERLRDQMKDLREELKTVRRHVSI